MMRWLGKRAMLLACTACLLLPAAASGQADDGGVKPINVDRLPASRPLLEYALAGGFLIGALAIAFKPSKRTPQQ